MNQQIDNVNSKVTNYPKYSVLMSVYFKEKPKWLHESLSSLLNQTYMPTEIVIVKDGKLTDELECVISTFEQRCPELFKIVSLNKNVGLGPALAIGIQECTFDYVMRMDSDDYSVPTRAEKLIVCMVEHPEYECVGSYEVEFEKNIEDVIAVHKVPVTSDEIKEFMKRRCAILHPTVLYRKSMVIRCGNYQDFRLYEDYDLFMRMVLGNEVKCYNLPEELYYIRINDNFFKRRGGFKYMKTVLDFKYTQYRNRYMTLSDYIISAGGQSIVCLMPNKLRKWFYLSFLRK